MDSLWIEEDRGYTTLCRIWQGVVHSTGYGKIKSEYAHRVAWEAHYGKKIPEGMVIDHLCRVRCCVNPEHMEVVTRGENVRRGIHPGKLSAQDIAAIRAAEFVNQAELAERYGVTQAHISKVRSGLTKRAGRKLTNEQREAIWNDKRPLRVIAAEYGVSASLASIIKRGSSPTATLRNP